MGREKAITLRFKPDCMPDMELYRRIWEEKERMGISMPNCTKELLNRGLKAGDDEATGTRLLDGIRKCIHEEMATLCAGIIESKPQTKGSQTSMSASALPEECGEQEGSLPDFSDKAPQCLNSMLEKFK